MSVFTRSLVKIKFTTCILLIAIADSGRQPIIISQSYNIFKVEKVLHTHYLQRYEDRKRDPRRFDIKPTLGQLAPRKKLARKAQFSSENDEMFDSIGKYYKYFTMYGRCMVITNIR